LGSGRGREKKGKVEENGKKKAGAGKGRMKGDGSEGRRKGWQRRRGNRELRECVWVFSSVSTHPGFSLTYRCPSA